MRRADAAADRSRGGRGTGAVSRPDGVAGARAIAPGRSRSSASRAATPAGNRIRLNPAKAGLHVESAFRRITDATWILQADSRDATRNPADPRRRKTRRRRADAGASSWTGRSRLGRDPG